MPVSLLLIPLALGGYLLLAIPLVSIMLAMFGFTFIPPLLINIAVIGAAVEAHLGSTARGWMLLPIIWFGLFAGLAVADRAAIGGVQRAVHQHNDSIRIPFDAAGDVVAFTDHSDAEAFVRQYGLRAVVTPAGGKPMRVRLGEGLVCDRNIPEPPGVRRHWIVDRNAKPRRLGGTLVPGRCILTEDGGTSLRTIRVEDVEGKERLTGTGFSRILRRDTIVSRSDGQRFVLKGGTAKPMGFIPFPVFGCYPNGSQWQCEVAMIGGSWVSLSGSGEDDSSGSPLGRALGLTPLEPPAPAAQPSSSSS